MGQSYLRLSGFEVNREEALVYIEGATKDRLLQIDCCRLCGKAVLGYPCSAITNGIPYIKVPAREVNRYTLSELDQRRVCREI